MTDGVIVREAEERDLEVLAKLMTELGYPTSVEEMNRRFEEISAAPSYDTLVAEQGGKVLGMVCGFWIAGANPIAPTLLVDAGGLATLFVMTSLATSGWGSSAIGWCEH